MQKQLYKGARLLCPGNAALFKVLDYIDLAAIAVPLFGGGGYQRRNSSGSRNLVGKLICSGIRALKSGGREYCV